MIVPVLLSGGTGSRLWPLSREAFPKQLLPLAGPESMLQATLHRAVDPELFDRAIVVANAEHRFLIAEQLRSVKPQPRIVLEPDGRNTAPAVAVAALLATRDNPEAVILVMPADHIIGDVPDFQETVRRGLAAAHANKLVLFGITPTKPETGYGYIRLGPALSGTPGVHAVASFTEKPDERTAREYIEDGSYAWNGGIFLLPAAKFLEELGFHEPAVLAAAREALERATTDLDFLRLDAASFRASPSISIDYAVMERTKDAAVMPVSFPWSDVGAWSALWDIGEKDNARNVSIGDVVLHEVQDSYIRTEGQLVAAIGVRDLVIVATPDAVLVTSKNSDQSVKTIVEKLRATGRQVATQTQTVHRPWGSYESIAMGNRFQVKKITVAPGGKLSLQKHFHRAEHWVVVNGTAIVTRDGEEVLLRENESVFLPLGCVHRLENPGKVPLNLIEVQSGAYLGEDDIVRIEDVYARF